MTPRANTFFRPIKQEQGFSLIELMIIILLISIIMSIALPAGRDFILQSRLSTQANLLVADLLYARSEAAARGLNVAICPSSDAITCSADAADWTIGRYTFEDTNRNGAKDAGEPRLKLPPSMPPQMTLTPQGFNSTTMIRFNNSGGLIPLGSSGSFKLCTADVSTGRQISVGINGRPSSTKVACP